MAGRSVHTIRKTKLSLRDLERLCKVGCLAAIDRGTIMAFRAKRLEGGMSPATINLDVRQIRSALSYAVETNLLRANPLLRWKGAMIPEPENTVRVVEEDEFGKLLVACAIPSFRAMLMVGYRQGLRRQELSNLRWAAVDLDRRTLHVVNVAAAGELTKSRKNRSLPMHPLVHAALSEMWQAAPKRIEDGRVCPQSPYVFTWPDGTPFKADWTTHEFARLVEKAKIAHCTMHDLRRSFSTLAQRLGVDRFTVKDLGGWSTVSVVERHYTGEVPEVYRRAMDRIAGTA
jgi:integrase